MQKLSHTIRVDAEDLERWKQATVQAGMWSASEWMRRTLNEECDRIGVHPCIRASRKQR